MPYSWRAAGPGLSPNRSPCSFSAFLSIFTASVWRRLKSRNTDRSLPFESLHAVQLTAWRDPNCCTEAESSKRGSRLSAGLSHCGYDFHTMKPRNWELTQLSQQEVAHSCGRCVCTMESWSLQIRSHLSAWRREVWDDQFVLWHSRVAAFAVVTFQTRFPTKKSSESLEISPLWHCYASLLLSGLWVTTGGSRLLVSAFPVQILRMAFFYLEA